jgi:cytoskeletal protein CcmA (bactofilin family)
MWNQDDRDNKFKPAQPAQPAPVNAPATPKSTDGSEMRPAQFGRSLYLKGEVTGAEDLTIDGQLEGRIDLSEHALTVGPNATILADVTAKVVTIFGSVTGSITASEKIDIRKGGSVEGSVTCARIAVQDGAILSGKFETQAGRSSRARTAPIANAA